MDSPDLRKRVNEFLFKEFRYDRRKIQRAVTEAWPLLITCQGTIKTSTREEDVYEFTWRKEAFFITCESGLVRTSYWPVAGMTLGDFQNQFQGWELFGQTIDLDTAVLGEEGSPRSHERQAAILSLAQAVPQEPKASESVWFVVPKRRQNRTY